MINFSNSGETKTIATYTNCITNITVSDPNNWGNTYTANNGTLSLTVPSNSSSARTENVTISYRAGSTSCSKTVGLSQDGENIDYSRQYLTFIPTVSSTKFVFNVSGATNLQYSLDSGSTWTSIGVSAYTPYVAVGQKIMWKADGITTDQLGSGDSNFTTYPYSSKIIAEGNIMSLLYGDNFASATTIPNSYQFKDLFFDNGIVNAENLILPATTLKPYCYNNMFCYCTSLTKPPQLPATTLADSCYWHMFAYCTSLTTIPSNYLPATTLAVNCYHEMFQGCTSLTTAPQLPATTLATSCYQHMFNGCTSLTTLPALPATTLAIGCYFNMFNNCTSLTTIPSNYLPATTLAANCYAHMFSYCTSLTTVPSNLLPATTMVEHSLPSAEWGCYGSMFQGCTSLTTAPQLPATTLANYCYLRMFRDCTSLRTAPMLPATTTKKWCYGNMFWGCSSLNYVECLATDISAEDCTLAWLYNVSSSGTFVKASNMNNWPTGSSGIPSGWTVQNA